MNLAIALNQFGEHDEALSHAQKAVALKPMYAKAHHALGACYQDVGSERAAQRHWGIAEALASEGGRGRRLAIAGSGPAGGDRRPDWSHVNSDRSLGGPGRDRFGR